MVDPGYFQPEKPIFRAFFGVVHPTTPHPPILPPSVHKIHIPQPELNAIPTLQQKAPNYLRFLHIIYSYIEWPCREYRTTLCAQLISRRTFFGYKGKKKK